MDSYMGEYSGITWIKLFFNILILLSYRSFMYYLVNLIDLCAFEVLNLLYSHMLIWEKNSPTQVCYHDATYFYLFTNSVTKF